MFRTYHFFGYIWEIRYKKGNCSLVALYFYKFLMKWIWKTKTFTENWIKAVLFWYWSQFTLGLAHNIFRNKSFCVFLGYKNHETSQNFNLIRQPTEKIEIKIAWISWMSWTFERFQRDAESLSFLSWKTRSKL